MLYAKVRTQVRKGLISLELTNWYSSLQNLFDQTDVSGKEVYLAYSYNNFKNPFQQADEQRYKERGWWAELFRDIVREGGKGVDNKDRLDVVYVSHAGTKWQKEHRDWAPKPGWYVPTEDGIFVPETLIPFETLQNREEAIRRLEAKGIPPEQVSYFWRPDRYDSPRFVDRDFLPDREDGGRFYIDADRRLSYAGDGVVASRPAYREPRFRIRGPKIVMEVKEPAKVA